MSNPTFTFETGPVVPGRITTEGHRLIARHAHDTGEDDPSTVDLFASGSTMYVVGTTAFGHVHTVEEFHDTSYNSEPAWKRYAEVIVERVNLSFGNVIMEPVKSSRSYPYR